MGGEGRGRVWNACLEFFLFFFEKRSCLSPSLAVSRWHAGSGLGSCSWQRTRPRGALEPRTGPAARPAHVGSLPHLEDLWSWPAFPASVSPWSHPLASPSSLFSHQYLLL